MNQTTLPDPVAQFRAKDSVFTPSNLISLMRALMVVPAICGIIANLHLLVAAICIVAFISDLLDGMLARRMNDVSEIGKIIDPIADKIFVGCLVIAMAAYGLIPIWFLVTVIARDLIIVLAGVWASKKLKVVLPSNYPGKAAVLTISLSIFLVLVGVSGTPIVFMESLSLVLMAVSLVLYGKRLFGLLKATHALPA